MTSYLSRAAIAGALSSAKPGHDSEAAAARRIPPLALAAAEDVLALGAVGV
jgi:hypothetical protein